MKLRVPKRKQVVLTSFFKEYTEPWSE